MFWKKSVLFFNVSVWYGHLTEQASDIREDRRPPTEATNWPLQHSYAQEKLCQSSVAHHVPSTLSLICSPQGNAIESARFPLTQTHLMWSTHCSARTYESAGWTPWVWIHCCTIDLCSAYVMLLPCGHVVFIFFWEDTKTLCKLKPREMRF